MINLMCRSKREVVKDARKRAQEFVGDLDVLKVDVRLEPVSAGVVSIFGKDTGHGYSVEYVLVLPDGKTQRRLDGPHYFFLGRGKKK